MIKLTLLNGEPVLINILMAKYVMTDPDGSTLVGNLHVRESLDEIQRITLNTCVNMLRSINNAC